MGKYRISGVPVVNNLDERKLVGIITNRDMRFIQDYSIKISDVMTKEQLITAPVGTTLEEAERSYKSIKLKNSLLLIITVYYKGLLQ